MYCVFFLIFFFKQKTAYEIAAKLSEDRIPSLERGIPIDPELAAICKHALEPNREMRYPTAAELKHDLAKYLGTLGGPISQRELAQFVRKTVEDDRAKLQSVIDTQLQRLSLMTWGGTTPLPDLTR